MEGFSFLFKKKVFSEVEFEELAHMKTAQQEIVWVRYSNIVRKKKVP